MAYQPDISHLRALAAERGYTVERAIARDAWHLVDAKGKLAIKDNGSAAFSSVQAKRFLGEPKRKRRRKES